MYRRFEHTTTNVYLVSLAISDTIFFVTALPAEMQQLFRLEPFLGGTECALRVFLTYLSMNTSSLNVAAFSIERFIAICYPLKARCCVQQFAFEQITIQLIYYFNVGYVIIVIRQF